MIISHMIFCFKANSTYKHALKKFLKRKKWLIDDVIVPEIVQDIQNIKNDYLLFYVLQTIRDSTVSLIWSHNLVCFTSLHRACRLKKYTKNRINTSHFRYTEDFKSIGFSFDLETYTNYKAYTNYKEPTKKITTDFLVITVDLIDAQTRTVQINILVDGVTIFSENMDVDADKCFQFMDLSKVTLLKDVLNEKAKVYYDHFVASRDIKVKHKSDAVYFDELF